MIPKKAKDIIKKVCEEKGLDPSFMEDAVSCYWKEIRIQLSNLQHYHVYVAKFGTFSIKEWKLNQHIKDFGDYNARAHEIKYASDEKKRSMRQYHKMLLTLRNQRIKEKKQKKKIDEKKRAGDLGKQSKHPGGDKE